MALIFIGVIVVFLLASFYVASRICRMLKKRPRRARVAVWVTVLALDVSFLVARLIDSDSVGLNRVLYVVSTTWMPVVMFMFLILGAMNTVRWIIGANTGHDPYRTPLTVKVGAAVTIVLCLIGYYEATHTKSTRYDIYTSKLAKGERRRIVLVSDIHMGYAVTTKDVERLVSEINRLSADVVIIAGDLIDGDLLPVREERTHTALGKIQAREGVIAVMGNHDYMDDDKAAENLLRQTEGLLLLRDETADLAGMHIIGRDDLSHKKSYGTERKRIEDFGRADSLFTVVVDHQPGAICDAQEINADLSLSGHTHGGQIWPMSIVTGLMYTIDYGYGCFGNTCAIVTSGFGTWGPRMRLGTRSEVVAIDVIGTGETAKQKESQA